MNPDRTRLHSTLSRSVAAATLGAALLLSGCAGGSDSSTSGGAAEPGAPAGADQGSSYSEGSTASGADGKAVDGRSVGGKPAADVSPIVASQMLARTAGLSLDVKDLAQAAAKVRTIATVAGGLVVSEKLASDTGYSPQGSTTEPPDLGLLGTITIQVPGAKLDGVLTDLGKVGTVTSRVVSSEDVKSQVVDTQSRLQTMRESVARVRALMGQATKLSDIVALESELSRRQADLESLEGQLASLKDSVAMSPVTVTLQRTGTAPAEETPDNAFLVGLKNGWDAFAGAVAVILTILGALLPFAIVAAIVGGPILLWWRRRRATAPAGAPAGPAGPPAPPGPPAPAPAPEAATP